MRPWPTCAVVLFAASALAQDRGLYVSCGPIYRDGVYLGPGGLHLSDQVVADSAFSAPGSAVDEMTWNAATGRMILVGGGWTDRLLVEQRDAGGALVRSDTLDGVGRGVRRLLSMGRWIVGLTEAYSFPHAREEAAVFGFRVDRPQESLVVDALGGDLVGDIVTVPGSHRLYGFRGSRLGLSESELSADGFVWDARSRTRRPFFSSEVDVEYATGAVWDGERLWVAAWDPNPSGAWALRAFEFDGASREPESLRLAADFSDRVSAAYGLDEANGLVLVTGISRDRGDEIVLSFRDGEVLGERLFSRNTVPSFEYIMATISPDGERVFIPLRSTRSGPESEVWELDDALYGAPLVHRCLGEIESLRSTR
jgi:hypothetical protein